MRKLLLLLFSAISLQLAAQDEQLRNYDYVYVKNIKSVQFHIEGLFLTLPLIGLYSNDRLEFSFDDLGLDVKDYIYTIVHCDINWNPSQLSEMEYIDGFTEEIFDEYRFSFKTITPFTHYRMYLPNEHMRFTKSGNYLLKVYDNEDEKKLVITRRFMVADRQVLISPRVVSPAKVSKFKTHQEIDFTVDHPKLKIRSPRQEIKAVILQNGRWDNAISDQVPLFTRLNQMVFDYQDKIVFPAGKEFRYLDLRSLQYRSEGISVIERYDDRFEVILFKDEKRFNKPYFSRRDLNGKFVIESLDERNPDLSGDYAHVLFSLYSPAPVYDKEIYLFGAISDWQIKESFKMHYNNAVNAYVAKILLKQGYYDYTYAAVPKEGKDHTPDLQEIEGTWYETENEYTILIYYRPFGSRYDQLVGALTINSTS